MTDPRIVVVNSTIAQTGVAVEDYKTLLILDCNHLTFDRVTTYAVGGYDSVPSGSKLEKALDAAFSPDIKPATVKVGRTKGAATYTPTAVAVGKEYGFTITVLDGYSLNATYTTGAAETAQDVLDALKTAFDLDSDITDHVSLTVSGVGADAVLVVALVSAADDFTLTNYTGDYTTTGIASESAGDSMAEINQIDNQWSWPVSTNHDTAYQAAIGAATLTLNKKKHLGATQSAKAYEVWDGVSAPDADDLGALCKFNNYTRSNIYYHHNADEIFPEIVRYSRHALLEPGSSDFQKKVLPGVSLALLADESRKLNVAELIALKSKSMSTTVLMGGNAVTGGYEGLGNRMADGTRIESVYWTDRASQVIKALIEGYMLNKEKVGMNDNDINAIVSKIEKWLTSQATTLAKTYALDPRRPFIVTAPAAKDITFEDKVLGLYQGLVITAYADASMDSVIADLTLTFNDSEA